MHEAKGKRRADFSSLYPLYARLSFNLSRRVLTTINSSYLPRGCTGKQQFAKADCRACTCSGFERSRLFFKGIGYYDRSRSLETDYVAFVIPTYRADNWIIGPCVCTSLFSVLSRYFVLRHLVYSNLPPLLRGPGSIPRGKLGYRENPLEIVGDRRESWLTAAAQARAGSRSRLGLRRRTLPCSWTRGGKIIN